mmetsp:Transcript_30057/g.75662  ORF Transcript_30057/g.75662 Transcript_30057/m.75662 type:complete len:284 (-) Transcript_30057:177-1028(-)
MPPRLRSVAPQQAQDHEKQVDDVQVQGDGCGDVVVGAVDLAEHPRVKDNVEGEEDGANQAVPVLHRGAAAEAGHHDAPNEQDPHGREQARAEEGEVPLGLEGEDGEGEEEARRHGRRHQHRVPPREGVGRPHGAGHLPARELEVGGGGERQRGRGAAGRRGDHGVAHGHGARRGDGEGHGECPDGEEDHVEGVRVAQAEEGDEDRDREDKDEYGEALARREEGPEAEHLPRPHRGGGGGLEGDGAHEHRRQELSAQDAVDLADEAQPHLLLGSHHGLGGIEGG